MIDRPKSKFENKTAILIIKVVELDSLEILCVCFEIECLSASHTGGVLVSQGQNFLSKLGRYDTPPTSMGGGRGGKDAHSLLTSLREGLHQQKM